MALSLTGFSIARLMGDVVAMFEMIVMFLAIIFAVMTIISNN
ncbi:Putative uncharacterized protein [Moritella viscosa]|nr:Putative uncharacterized protein [Moritella viscosa]